jgi:hypothetical protein
VRRFLHAFSFRNGCCGKEIGDSTPRSDAPFFRGKPHSSAFWLAQRLPQVRFLSDNAAEIISFCWFLAMKMGGKNAVTPNKPE